MPNDSGLAGSPPEREAQIVLEVERIPVRVGGAEADKLRIDFYGGDPADAEYTPMTQDEATQVMVALMEKVAEAPDFDPLAFQGALMAAMTQGASGA